MSFIDPIRYPVAASEAATRAIRDQAAAANHGGHPVPPSGWGTAVSPPRTPEYWTRLAAEEQAVLVRWGGGPGACPGAPWRPHQLGGAPCVGRVALDP